MSDNGRETAVTDVGAPPSPGTLDPDSAPSEENSPEPAVLDKPLPVARVPDDR